MQSIISSDQSSGNRSGGRQGMFEWSTNSPKEQAPWGDGNIHEVLHSSSDAGFSKTAENKNHGAGSKNANPVGPVNQESAAKEKEMSGMIIGQKYLAKFSWSKPESIPTSLGVRFRKWAKVSGYERQVFLANKPKFDTLAVTMSEHPKASGIWFFVQWSMPQAEQVKLEEKSIQLSRAHDSTETIPAPVGYHYDPYQKVAIEYAMARKATLIADEPGLGKEQPIDSLVATPGGWRKIGDIKPGDFVIGSSGKAVAVKAVYPQGVKPVYRVNFSDGSSAEAGKEHLWTANYYRGGRYLQPITLTTDQIMNRPTVGDLSLSKTDLYLPMISGPIRFGKKKLPIEPYLLGQLIANGSLSSGTPVLTTNENDWDEVRSFISEEVIGKVEKLPGCFRCFILNHVSKVKSISMNVLSSGKFIPQVYMESSAKDREALLHGLMDADGSISKIRNKITYHSVSFELSTDVVSLVESLGGIATVHRYDRTSEGKPVEYQTRIRVPDWINPFRVSRKLSRFSRTKRTGPTRSFCSVEYSRDVECVCISVDAKDKLYVTDHCILTHNTVEAIGYINAFNANAGKRSLQRILIICPADLRLNWRTELSRWLVDKYSVDIVDGGVFPSTDIVIISYQSLSRFADKLTYFWCLVIADEAQYVSNPKSKMTQALCGFRPSKKEINDGHKHSSGIPAKRKIAMTGTPIRNRPKDIFSTLNWLDPVAWPSRNQFINEYCGGWGPEGWSENGSTNQEELQQILRSTIMIRREKKDVMTDLPPKRRSVMVLPIDKAEMSKIGILNQAPQMQAWMVRVAASKANLEFSKCLSDWAYSKAMEDMDQVMSGGAAATFELLHAIALAKVPSAIEILKRAVGETPKVVIFVHHRDVMQLLKKEFPGALEISGSVSNEDRHRSVDVFQNEPTSGPIFVSIACAKGITLTAASNEYFMEGSWLPGEIMQAEDRLHRRGQKECVNVTHLVMDGSIDIVRANMVIRKQAVIDKIINIDHKVETEREPVIPMPGVSITRQALVESAKEEYIAEYRDQCAQMNAEPSEHMQLADRMLLNRICSVPWDSKIAVLGKMLIESYQPKSK